MIKEKYAQTGRWLSGNIRLLSLVLGSFYMCIWAMIRFFAKSSNFDLVGQQVLTHQWLSGVHGGALIGPTNYIIKMLLLYAPFDLLAVSPRAKLIVMTLLVDVVAYIFIVFILEKLWKEFHPVVPKTFYAATLWLALAAGSVFWIQFTNSRNLEVAGGLFLIYLIIRLRKAQSISRYILIIFISALLVFADPLQLYMSAIPAILFLVSSKYFVKRSKKESLILGLYSAVVVCIGFILAKCLTWSVQKLFGVEFIVATSHRGASTLISTIMDSIIPTVKQMARLYVGGFELGRYVEAVNLLFVATVVTVAICYTLQRKVSRSLFGLIGLVFLSNTAVYILSGQALQGGTGRYLIMTVPFFVLLTALVLSHTGRVQKLLIGGMIAILVINSTALIRATYTHWDTSFSKDAHISATIEFMKNSSYLYAYGSMDTAIPGDYYSDNSVKLLPVKCEPGSSLERSFLFFDKENYRKTTARNQLETPLILDGETINNYPATCNLDTIKFKFGQWNRVEYLSDGSRALIYETTQFNRALGLSY